MTIVSDPVSSATWRIQRYADSLTRANDDGDRERVFGLLGNIEVTARATRQTMLPEIYGLRPATDHDDLRAALFHVRQQRQHLLGSPWDQSRLALEESRLVAQLHEVNS